MKILAELAASLPPYDPRAEAVWLDAVDDGCMAALGRGASAIFDDLDVGALYRSRVGGEPGAAASDGLVGAELLSIAVHAALEAPRRKRTGALGAYLAWRYGTSRCTLLCARDERRIRELQVSVDAGGIPIDLPAALRSVASVLRGWLTRSPVDHASRLGHLAIEHDLATLLESHAEAANEATSAAISEHEAGLRGRHLYFLHLFLGAATSLTGDLPAEAHPAAKAALEATVAAHVFTAPEPTSPGTYTWSLSQPRR